MSDDIDTLIETVLRLDGEATPEPWLKPFDDGALTSEARRNESLLAIDVDGMAVIERPEDAALIASYRSAAPRLARVLRESRAEAATLRAVSGAADERLTEALERHMLHDDGRGWSWERAAKVLDARADEVATLRAERDRLREAIRQAPHNEDVCDLPHPPHRCTCWKGRALSGGDR